MIAIHSWRPSGSAPDIPAENARHPGLTPFSNMMLAGSKADGTDLHTVVANQLKIDRGQAKVGGLAAVLTYVQRSSASSSGAELCADVRSGRGTRGEDPGSSGNDCSTGNQDSEGTLRGNEGNGEQVSVCTAVPQKLGLKL